MWNFFEHQTDIKKIEDHNPMHDCSLIKWEIIHNISLRSVASWNFCFIQPALNNFTELMVSLLMEIYRQIYSHQLSMWASLHWLITSNCEMYLSNASDWVKASKELEDLVWIFFYSLYKKLQQFSEIQEVQH